MRTDTCLLALRRQSWRRKAVLWLLAGTAVLLLTPLDAWTPLLGWAPLLALVISPLLMLLTLQPGLPLSVLAVCLRRGRRRPVWAGWRG